MRSALNGFYDDVYADAAGAASTVANEVESAGRWVGQEFDDFVGQFPMQGSLQADANANAAAGDPPTGIVTVENAWDNDILYPLENSLGKGLGELVIFGAIGLALFLLIKEK